MKNRTKIILGIIVLLIIVLAVYFASFITVEAPQSKVPADWKEYTDPISGIKLQAPQDFVVKDYDANFSDAKLFLLIIPTSTPFVNTHLLRDALIAIDPPISNCNENNLGPVSSSTERVINGISFVRIVTSEAAAGNLYQEVIYTTARKGLCYRITLFTHSTNGEGFYTDNQEQIERVDAQQALDLKNLFNLFDLIAGTIRFTR